MEPFDAMCDLLNEEKKNKYSTIGGAPQMLKVYQHMNSGALGVYWPERDENDIFKNRTLLGRKLLGYENTDYWFWDLKNQRSFPCKDGRNKYVDMFEHINIRYIGQKDEKVQVVVNVHDDYGYMKNCQFKVKSNEVHLKYGDNFKLNLSYHKDHTYRVFPMFDLKRYVVPPRDVFNESHIYETKGILKDMFDIVHIDYDFLKEDKVCPQIKLRKNYYGDFCKYEIIDKKKIYKAGEIFKIGLFYDSSGLEQCGMEPYQYIKKYHIPTREELRKCYVRKLLVLKLLNCLVGIHERNS